MSDDVVALIEQGKKLAEDLEEIEEISKGEDFGVLSSIRSEQIQYYRESSATMLRLYAGLAAKDAEIARLRNLINPPMSDPSQNCATCAHDEIMFTEHCYSSGCHLGIRGQPPGWEPKEDHHE